MEEPGFVSDIYLPDMLYAITIRSPVAKGRLKSIECPNLPAGYTLISSKDIPGKNRLEDTDLPILAEDELSYIGEPVALLLGPDKNTLEMISRSCIVNVREDMPVFSIYEPSADMIAARREANVGDPGTAFANAASIVSNDFSTGIQEHWYAEPTGAVAWLAKTEPPESRRSKDSSVTFVISAATQWPFHVKRSVSQVLGLAASAVQIEPTLTGIHMDGRLWYPSLVSCHAALGASITQKPVRLILTREEDFFFSPKRCKTEITIKSALDDKGALVGIEVDAIVNLGAFGVDAQDLLDHVYLGCLGVYRTKNIRFSGMALRTNIPPQGAFAGFGLAQGLFAMECQASRIADTVGQDPGEWRKENFINTGTLPFGLPLKETVSVEQLIGTVMRMSDYRRKWASFELLRNHRRVDDTWAEKGESLRGIGIALGYQGNGLLHSGLDKGSYSVEMILEKDGSLEIKTSMVSSGCDYKNIWAEIASKILGVDATMVRINYSAGYPDSGPSTVSRNITVLTTLVEQACLAIRKQRFRDPLPIAVRKAIRQSKKPILDIDMDLSGFTRPGWGSAVVEVTIDPIEYIPNIRSVWMGVNGGKIISEDNARRSLKSAVVQALGWAYREKINYIHGAIPADQFENFDIPGPSEIPPINIEFIRNGSEEPRGIGDLPFTCVPAAYLQAVSQAMDHHFQSIPLKSQDIWYALIRKRKEGAA